MDSSLQQSCCYWFSVQFWCNLAYISSSSRCFSSLFLHLFSSLYILFFWKYTVLRCQDMPSYWLISVWKSFCWSKNTILSLSNFVIFSIFMLSCPQCADIALVHPLNDSPGFHSFSLKTTRKRKKSGSSEANDFCFNLCSPVFLLISHSPHRCDQVCRLQQSW